MQVGLGPGHIVLDEDPAILSPNRGQSPQFSAHFCCGLTAGCIKMPLCVEVGLIQGDFVLDGDPVPPPQKLQFSAYVYCGQTVVCIRTPLGTEAGLSLDNILLDGDPVPPPLKGLSPPIFDQCPLWPNG